VFANPRQQYEKKEEKSCQRDPVVHIHIHFSFSTLQTYHTAFRDKSQSLFSKKIEGTNLKAHPPGIS